MNIPGIEIEIALFTYHDQPTSGTTSRLKINQSEYQEKSSDDNRQYCNESEISLMTHIPFRRCSKTQDHCNKITYLQSNRSFPGVMINRNLYLQIVSLLERLEMS